MVWVHYTLAIMLLVYAGRALDRRRATTLGAGALLVAGAAIMVLLAPLGMAMASTWRQAGTLSFGPDPTVLDLVGVLAVPLVAGLAPVVLSAPSQQGVPRRWWPERGSAEALLACWAILPPVLTYAAATLTQAKLFHSRYYVSMFAAVAMILAAGIRRIPSARLRALALVAAVGGCAWLQRGVGSVGEDWRGATRAVRGLSLHPDTPVLHFSGLVESLDPVFLGNKDYRSYLASPLLMYPVPGRVVVLPSEPQAATVLELERRVDAELQSASQLVMISQRGGPAEWLRSRAADRGFGWRDLGEFSGVNAVLLERSAGVPDSKERGQ